MFRSHPLRLVLLLLIVWPAAATAQEPLTENTVKLTPGAERVTATLADAKFLVGHWGGEALGGWCDEVWSPPRGGAMMGMFRLVQDGEVAFYELFTLADDGGSLRIRLKHFHGDLTGWEEKNETVDFPLVAKAEGELRFDGLTLRRAGADGLTVFLAMRQKDGSHKEVAFQYRRQPL